MKVQADIGIIGLAVMGENLALNLKSRGFTVAVHNRTVPGVEEGVVARFLDGRGRGRNFLGAETLEALVRPLESPRRILMMVKAGRPVDELIERLVPLLDRGDILIDGGNSHFADTARRTARLESAGMLYTLSLPDALPIWGGRRGRCAGLPSCPGDPRPPGPGCGRSCRRSRPGWRTAPPAANGWGRGAPVTS